MTTSEPCRCNCGYRCGGPGRCETPGCWSIDDGKHYVRDCDHKWDGPWVEAGLGESVTCSRCGMSCISHDMRCGA